MINSVNLFLEADKNFYGGFYPDEPLTGHPGLTSDDYGYLKHDYTRDQEEMYEMTCQLRDVFDEITLRDNLTRYGSGILKHIQDCTFISLVLSWNMDPKRKLNRTCQFLLNLVNVLTLLIIFILIFLNILLFFDLEC